MKKFVDYHQTWKETRNDYRRRICQRLKGYLAQCNVKERARLMFMR